MPRPKADTVGSLVKHGEAVTMSIDEGKDCLAPRRWRCSCKMVGHWSLVPRYELVDRWQVHVRRNHPEVEEL